MHYNKDMQNHSRSSANTTHLQPNQKTFRTLLKRRNETIPASQLYELDDKSKSRSNSKQSSRSQASSHQLMPKLQKVDIKSYVKQMLVNKQEQGSTSRDTLQKVFNYEGTKLPRKSSCSNRSQRSICDELKDAERQGDAKVKWSTDELQKKIEELIMTNFQRYKQGRGLIGMQNWAKIKRSASLQKDIEDIMECLRKMKIGTQSRECLQELTLKIELVQKIMASESTEAQIIKNQYFAWKNQRSNTASFSNKKLLNSVTKLNSLQQKNMPIIKQKFSEQNRSKEPIVKYSSTSKLFYAKPDREYYLSPEHKNHSFVANRQPITKTSYSQQFLNYGHYPIYTYRPSKYKDLPELPLTVKASTYQQQYKDKYKITKNVDFKELDCFKDKFKNTDISFMNSCKKQFMEKSGIERKHHEQVSGKQLKENIHSLIKKDDSLLKTMCQSTCNQFYKTGQMRQFSSLNNSVKVNRLRSQIKDHKLSNLKQSFKSRALKLI